MSQIDTTPVPEVSTDHFRSYLRDYLDQVRMQGSRLIVTRRGRPMAGLVPAHEARALWRVANTREDYAEWKMLQRLNEDRRLRMALLEEAEARRRAEFAAGR
ncbi:type II toxin-antitoxin system Phd/YefM family antitoxin [Roseovarius sp. ZX-A-9]|uniref:type II toxin-antitoxin system Phd/YefM family antitoxin n=1 Tax=Roseovarius sp. ZX-A-9 TaxID=3014783 RepID=UPI00232E22C9|nr:type II toxin-antitoxin system prevent-host-death family antitoxin [Roseovarius sp. ZX-A-9]